MDERADTGAGDGVEDAPGALDVDRSVTASSRLGWIAQARWMTASAPARNGSRSSVVTSAPAHSTFGVSTAGHAAGDPEDLLHLGLAPQCFQHAGADVAARSGDDYAHPTRPLRAGSRT